MRELTVAVIAFIAVQFCVALHGQNIKLDLTEVDTGMVVVKTGSIVDSSATDSVVDIGQVTGQTVEMQLKFESTEHSSVKFDVNGQGEITNVEWKKSDVDTAGYQGLDSSRYELSPDKSEIKLVGCGMYINDDMLSNEWTLNYYDPASLSFYETKAHDENSMYDIFPGNYVLSSNASSSLIYLEVRDDCYFSEKVYFAPSAEGNKERLHLETFDLSMNTLTLKGTKVECLMNTKSGEVADVGGLRGGVSTLVDNAVSSLVLMPGTYKIGIVEGGVISAINSFQILNKTARLSPVMFLADAEQNFEEKQLAPGEAYLTPTSMYVNREFEPIDPANQSLPFAVLKEKLDGGYYLSQRGVFRLRYDERYAENSPLDLKIYDRDRALVSLTGPVAREYGTNWIELTLPQGDFVVGEYYVMEVRGPKGDLGLLRFRYEQ